MFGWLKRLFRIGKAEANALLDQMEDPVKMTEQGIKDLKRDLDKSLQALAEIKSMSIKSRKQLDEARRKSSDYEAKAIQLIQKSQTGGIDPQQADMLAQKALDEKARVDQTIVQLEKDTGQYEKLQSEMQSKVSQLKTTIAKYEGELKTLKARSQVSKASERVAKITSGVDPSGTIARLERMKEKVDEQEALAEAYGDMADKNKSLDDEINDALGSSDSDSLAQLKSKMSNQQQIGDGSNPGAKGAEGQGMSELEKLKSKLKNQ